MKLLRKTQVSKLKKQEHIDSFINRLKEEILKCKNQIEVKTTVKLELESHGLPVVPLILF